MRPVPERLVDAYAEQKRLRWLAIQLPEDRAHCPRWSQLEDVGKDYWRREGRDDLELVQSVTGMELGGLRATPAEPPTMSEDVGGVEQWSPEDQRDSELILRQEG